MTWRRPLAQYRFRVGQTLYYKPRDFAPLQVTAGGECEVIQFWNGGEDDLEYLIQVAGESQQRIVRESELTPLKE